MEKDLLRKVIQNYPASTRQEAEEIHALTKAYPFCQLLHVLSARTSKEHTLEYEKSDLQLAAVYSADRGVLKALMTDEYLSSEISPVEKEQQQTSETPKTHTEAEQNQTAVSKETETPSADSNDIAATVIKDVKKLYDARHNFEMMFAGVQPKEEAEHSEGRTKSKRERIIELSKALNATNGNSNSGESKSVRRRRERKELIDEIVETKTQIEPTDEKQKEQLTIIEQFIQTQPTISNAKDKPITVPDGDLSSIKSGEFTENIVSETLVELLVKQGKKDKAIEVLKKLIWKFPQKKSYFAAQIEELKK